MVNLDAPLKLDERQVVGKGLEVLRRDGLVPAVIHNHGQPSIHVMGKELELGSIYHEAGKHHPLQLQVGSQSFLALIKDVHFHPAKRRLEHLVFQTIRQDEAVEAEVPIHLKGEIPAERAGFTIFHQLDSVEVEALPKDLPDELIIDATKLVELGDKITVADLQVPEGVTVKAEADHPIATVMETKAMISEEELAADAEAAAQAAAESEEAVETAAAGLEAEALEGAADAEATGKVSPKE